MATFRRILLSVAKKTAQTALVLLLGAGFAELASHLLYSSSLLPESARISSSIAEYVLRDSPVFEFKPNLSFTRTVLERASGRTIYASKISTDSLRRRRISRIGSEPVRDILFVGDSFTFGTGVSDEQTFEQLLQDRLPTQRVLNFGLPAAGPQDVYEDFVAGDRWIDIHRSNAIAVYTGIDNHVERLLCKTWRCFDQDRMRDRTPSKTRYVVENGNLVSRGSFRDSMSVCDYLLQLVSGSRLLHLSGWDYYMYKHSDYQFYGRFFSLLRDRFAEQGIRFVYVLFPGWSHVHGRKIVEALGTFKIETLDYSQFPIQSRVKGPMFVEGDGHPSPETHGVYAEILLHDLFQNGDQKSFEKSPEPSSGSK